MEILPVFRLRPPILWLAAAFAVGIAVEAIVPVSPVCPLGLALLVLAAAVSAGRGGPRYQAGPARPDRHTGAAMALLLAAFLAGIAYASVRARLPVNAVGRLAGGAPDYRGVPVRLVGTVASEPEGEAPRRFRLSVEQAEGRPAAGLVQVSEEREGSRGAGSQTLNLHYGRRLEVAGRLALPRPPGNPGEFDHAAYLAHQGVQAVLWAQELRPVGEAGGGNPLLRLSLGLRNRLERVLQDTLPRDQAALLAGLLFGSRSDLPPEVAEDFRLAGIYHMLAVSGSNVAFVALPILVLLTRLLGRRAALWGTVAVVLFYILLTGSSPSVVRAGTMAALVLTGEALGREAGGLPALGAAGLLLLLWNPGNLWDPGFQLSFAATAGILTLTRPVGERLRRLPSWVGAPLAVTLAAQAAVLPLSLLFWQGISLVSLAANLAVAPLVEVLVWVGSALVLLGLIARLPALWLAWAAGLLLRLLTGSTHLLARAPLAFVTLPAPKPWEAAVYYLGLAAVAAPGLARARCLRQGLLLPIALALAVVLRVAPTLGPDRLQAAFLDVGQGDAAVLRLPGGRVMLVDGGGHQEGQESRRWDPGEKVVVPYLQRLGVRRIDYLVVTHPHADHVAGLIAVIRRFPVGEVWYGGQPSELISYRQFLQEAAAHRLPLRRLERGQRYRLGDLEVAVLGPPSHPYTGQRSNENANSVVLQVTYGEASLLFTGDIEAPVEQDLLNSPGIGLRHGISLLKVGHHGSRYASSAAWLRSLRFGIAVVSVGANSFGHPAEETLRRLNQAGQVLVRTDWDGAVLYRTDGRREEIQTVRTRRIWRRGGATEPWHNLERGGR